MRIETRVQQAPAVEIDGITKAFLIRPLATRLRYVVVTVDGRPVGQQSVLFQGEHWRVNDFFVAKAYRGTRASRELRCATYRELAKETDVFRAWIAFDVAPIETVLEDPLRRDLGVEARVVLQHAQAALYEFRGVRRAASRTVTLAP